MKIEQYLAYYKITVREFARRAGIAESAIWHYKAGRHKPSQTNAEKIETASHGVVTVFEQRGKDDRKLAG